MMLAGITGGLEEFLTSKRSMRLQEGARLGPYEVTAQIGQGGMGEVYRARDTKLNRDVALKVLPDLFASDPDRLASVDQCQ